MHRYSKRFDNGSRRKGTVLPLVAASLTVLLSFVALTVDVGYLYVAVAESQRTADASSLAGAAMLHRSEDILTVEEQAHSAATDILGMNPVALEEVTEHAVIEVGHWEGVTRTFSSMVKNRTIQPNAVRVVAPRRDIGLFFAPVMGIDTADVSREAVASAYSGSCAGIWGIEGIQANGSVGTDSYNSGEGDYGSGSVYPNGDLCSCEDIRVSGSVAVNGDVMYGDGYGFRQDGSSGSVYGVVTDVTCGEVTTPADFDDAMFNNNNDLIGLTSAGTDPFPKTDWDLRMESDETITLSGGTYFFDTVRMTGQAKIIVTGPTVIYVSGNASFSGGGIVNATGDPANLLVFSEGSDLLIKGGSGFHGAVYAPETDVLLTGTPNYYGTIVGRTVEIQGDTLIHVDEKIVEDLFGLKATNTVLVK